jgi:selenocysteine lyase/cysteine desulfurase
MLDLPDRGVASALRLSPHYYNTEAEIDSAVAAIAELAELAAVTRQDA